MRGPETGFVIHVLSGPLAQGAFPAAERIEIGRTEEADIQLVNEKVSRNHASIIATTGGHVLLDRSSNGTWVGGERVTEHQLSDGDRFTIAGHEFEFKLAPAATDEASESSENKSVVSFDRGPTYSRIARTYPQSDMHKFIDRDGRDYEGNLLADIMVYRNLRLRLVQRQESASAEDRRTFEELDAVLRSSESKDRDDPERRVFNRFACDLPGRLRTDERSPQSLDVKMHDVSVDGARVHTRESTADLADRVLWLSLPVLCPQGLRCMVFTAVVAWRARSQVGLIFSGAPNWARRAGTSNERTVPIPKIGA